MKKEFTIEELEERIADINSYYLTNAIANSDKKMITHWQNILKKYEQNLAYLRATEKK